MVNFAAAAMSAKRQAELQDITLPVSIKKEVNEAINTAITNLQSFNLQKNQ